MSLVPIFEHFPFSRWIFLIVLSATASTLGFGSCLAVNSWLGFRCWESSGSTMLKVCQLKWAIQITTVCWEKRIKGYTNVKWSQGAHLISQIIWKHLVLFIGGILTCLLKTYLFVHFKNCCLFFWEFFKCQNNGIHGFIYSEVCWKMSEIKKIIPISFISNVFRVYISPKCCSFPGLCSKSKGGAA